MIGLVDGLKVGGGAVAGGALVALVMSAWFQWIEIPAAERLAHQAGVEECEAAARQASIQERERQQRELMRTVLEDAAAIRREAARSEDLQRQLMELAHDALSSADADACHINVDGVRSITSDIHR